MKRFYLILLLFVSVCNAVMAQEEDKNDGGRLQAYKIAFLTKRLDLSPAEAQRFWPVYNKYQDEIRSIRMEYRKNKGSEIEMEEKILNIRKKYNSEFSKAVSPEKVNTFFRAEKEFGTIVKQEMMERRDQNRKPRERK